MTDKLKEIQDKGAEWCINRICELEAQLSVEQFSLNQLRKVKEQRDAALRKMTVMEDALFTAAETFQEYAQIHAHKNPPDIRKSEFNQCCADEMRKALSSVPPVGVLCEEEPIWYHKHYGKDDDIFYNPKDTRYKIPEDAIPLYRKKAL